MKHTVSFFLSLLAFSVSLKFFNFTFSYFWSIDTFSFFLFFCPKLSKTAKIMLEQNNHIQTVAKHLEHIKQSVNISANDNINQTPRLISNQSWNKDNELDTIYNELINGIRSCCLQRIYNLMSEMCL